MTLSKSKANTKVKEANPEFETRFLFQNFTSQFGGKTFLQMSGGPIGARVTMAAARIVMNSWARQYSGVLIRSGSFVHAQSWLEMYAGSKKSLGIKVKTNF